MMATLKNLLLFCLATIVCFVVNSCEKTLPKCKGNCVSIQLSGKIYNLNTNAGLGGEAVGAYWYRRGLCLGCDYFKIAEGKTRSDGSFNFTQTIDTTYFRDYRIYLRTPVNTNYFFTPGGSADKYRQVFFDSVAITSMQQIRFGYYPKASLQLQLHRVQNDAFSYFAYSTFVSGAYLADTYNLIPGSQQAHDTTVVVNTAADTYTIVQTSKLAPNGSSIRTSDSIRCTQTGPNVININY